MTFAMFHSISLSPLPIVPRTPQKTKQMCIVMIVWINKIVSLHMIEMTFTVEKKTASIAFTYKPLDMMKFLFVFICFLSRFLCRRVCVCVCSLIGFIRKILFFLLRLTSSRRGLRLIETNFIENDIRTRETNAKKMFIFHRRKVRRKK